MAVAIVAGALLAGTGTYAALYDRAVTAALERGEDIATAEDEDAGYPAFLFAVPVRAAEILAGRESGVTVAVMRGVLPLSRKSVEALSRHRGNLTVLGVGRLSVAAAEALARHEGRLSLTSFSSLSEPVAAAHWPQNWLGNKTGRCASTWIRSGLERRPSS